MLTSKHYLSWTDPDATAISTLASHLQYTAVGLVYPGGRPGTIALFTLYSASPVTTFTFASGSATSFLDLCAFPAVQPPLLRAGQALGNDTVLLAVSDGSEADVLYVTLPSTVPTNL